MEELTLKALPRKLLGKKVKNLRRDGQLPAVLYGRNFASQSLIIPQKEFTLIASQAGEATIINLQIDGKDSAKILIRKIQKDPVSDEILHVDLYKVDMNQEIQTEIPLEFIGVSAAVEELEGNLITNKDSIKVECLPDKLVSKIEVDISALKTFEDLIHIKDLNIPEAIKVLDEPDMIIAQVTPPRSEEELVALEEETKTAAETEKAKIEGIEAEAEAEKAAKTTEEGAPASDESESRPESVGKEKPKKQ